MTRHFVFVKCEAFDRDKRSEIACAFSLGLWQMYSNVPNKIPIFVEVELDFFRVKTDYRSRL